MPDEYENEHEEDPNDEPGNADIKRMRELAKKGAKAEQVEEENTQLRKQLAFTQAGVDLTSDEGAFFARAYEGDLDAAAIKAHPMFSKLVNPSTSEAEPASTETDPGLEAEIETAASIDELEAVASNKAGQVTDPTQKKNPYEEAKELHDQVIRDGGTSREAGATGVASLMQAALAGDERVLIPQGLRLNVEE